MKLRRKTNCAVCNQQISGSAVFKWNGRYLCRYHFDRAEEQVRTLFKDSQREKYSKIVKGEN